MLLPATTAERAVLTMRSLKASSHFRVTERLLEACSRAFVRVLHQQTASLAEWSAEARIFHCRCAPFVGLDVRALVGEEHTTRAVCVLLPAATEVTIRAGAEVIL